MVFSSTVVEFEILLKIKTTTKAAASFAPLSIINTAAPVQNTDSDHVVSQNTSNFLLTGFSTCPRLLALP